MKPFAENIKKFRKQSNLTQGQMAVKLSVKRSRIAAWEEGRGCPDTEELIRVCTILKVNEPLKFFADKNYFSNLSKVPKDANYISGYFISIAPQL